MKVSEAVERLQHDVDLQEPYGRHPVEYISDLKTLLASHEALRLAALPFAESAKHIPAETPDERSAMNRETAGKWRALSLAVEEAGR